MALRRLPALPCAIVGACAWLWCTLTVASAAERRIEFDTDEGTWLSLDLAPDSRHIVFDLLGDLYALDAAGGVAQRLTSGPAFDSQPVYSPDGTQLAWLSDVSGAENLWIARADGSGARQLTTHRDDPVFVSPEWSADGKALFVSRYRAELHGFELWKYPLDTAQGELLIPIRATPDQPRSAWQSSLGARPSADGRYLYYAANQGGRDSEHLPEWTIRRRDLASGLDETMVSAPRSPRTDLIIGTAFRPALAPNGRWLVYGARSRGRTGLRVLDLTNQVDRWLAYPVTQDESMASGTRDLLPRHDFTADSSALLLNDGGHIVRLELATGARTTIPFSAHVDQRLPPLARSTIRQETGPVRARLIQAPEASPDHRQLAFSALGHVYLMDLHGDAPARRLGKSETPEFQPSWSPDGRELVYVTWTAADGGHVWAARGDGAAPPRRISEVAAFYTSPVFTPDGNRVIVLSSSNSVRMHSYMEYGALRAATLLVLPAAGGAARVIASGTMGGKPHFTQDHARVHLPMDDGLNSIALDGSGRKRVLQVVGHGWYFSEGTAPVDDLRISPDGRWALAQIAQQLHLVAVPTDGGTVDLTVRSAVHRRLTDVGADFFDWSHDGASITWAVGSTFHRRPLAKALPGPADAGQVAGANLRSGDADVDRHEVSVELPRDRPHGALVLRGGTALTMDRNRVIERAEILIVDDRIAAIGGPGEIGVPDGATVRDLGGRYIVPGFIDTHTHLADVRRVVLDLQSWGALANLAYGVTTVFDPSPLSIDMLVYEDLIDTGQMTGARIHSTGPALFSFNAFESPADVHAVLRRYRDHYRILNLKQYRVGNRQVRGWVADAARELGMMPTTEGALSMKQNLTQVLDGYSGIEHALTAVPLQRDVIELMARSGTSYTATLSIGNGGPDAQDHFIVRDHPRDDPKLNRFAPQFVVDVKMQSRTWRETDEYLFPRIAAGVAQIQRAGGVIGMGSHGETPGLGLHWEMQAHAMGGMSATEVLQAATLGAARTIGREAEFGSLEAGKFADLVILERDPRVDLANALSISEVMKNGRLYNAATMDEVWPRQRALAPLWFWGDRAPEAATATAAQPLTKH